VLKGVHQFPTLGNWTRERERRWFRERPRVLVRLHARLRRLDLAGKRDEYEECCWLVDEMLLCRGEIR
jgi:hypothetical protein